MKEWTGKHFLPFLCYLSFAPASAQQDLDSSRVVRALKNIPNFTINKDNYFISGSKLGQTPSDLSSDAKMQISFKQRLHNKPLPFNSFLFFVYTQKSFWDVYRTSSPFSETNFNPNISLARSVFRHHKFHGVLAAQVEHESNGLAGDNSHGWDNFSISYFYLPQKNIRFFLKGWVPFFYSTNPDLMEYIGYTESRFTWVLYKNNLILDLTVRKAPAWNWHGNVQIECSYKLFKAETFYVFLQWWEGYAESLSNYREATSRIRIGIVFKPSYFLFY
jgi:phospholipase A1/A2